jgi:hypothetical protein
VPKITRSQRCINRPTLEKIFLDSILRDKGNLDKKMVEVVEKYAYQQRNIVRYLNVHVATLGNFVRMIR